MQCVADCMCNSRYNIILVEPFPCGLNLAVVFAGPLLCLLADLVFLARVPLRDGVTFSG